MQEEWKHMQLIKIEHVSYFNWSSLNTLNLFDTYE